MVMSEILKSADSPKQQKSKYLENKTLFSPSTKKIHLLQFKWYNMAKNSFIAEATFNFEQKPIVYH